MHDDTAAWLAAVNQPDYRNRLKEWLRARKMSQKEFAYFCGCSASNISFLLNGYYSGVIPKYIWQKARDLGFAIVLPTEVAG